ncbi:MAG: ribosome recycling factor [Candidatus Doudnabacteria bacterium]|nr:ribosome recycling factor [Candidatus Doudnabacteria bacterium]
MNSQMIASRESDFEKIIEHFKQELATLRTGRASSSLVEHMMVDFYGVPTELLAIAQIAVPEPRQITIQPYDRNALKDIEKAVQQSNLGINPVNDGAVIRLTIPAMTEDRRKELGKIVAQMTEKARVSIRNVREEIWKEVQRQEQGGDISEDDKISAKDQLQKIVDKWNAEIKKLSEIKEQEVMTI